MTDAPARINIPKLAGDVDKKKGSKDSELQKMRKWADDEGFELGQPFDAYDALRRNVEETVLLKVGIYMKHHLLLSPTYWLTITGGSSKTFAKHGDQEGESLQDSW